MLPGSGRVCEEPSGAAGQAGRDNDGGGGRPAGSSGNAGSAGTGDDVAGEGGGGAGTGAESGSAGDTGGSPAGAGGRSSDFEIDGQTRASGCTGSELTFALSANGGRAPYEWTLEPTSGFALTADGTRATLAGTPTTAGDVTLAVEVIDADGHRAEREWHVAVYDPPVITTAELPNICPREVYAVTLAATGGDGESYVWSSSLEPATGLAVEAGEVRGTLAPEIVGPTTLDVELTVESSGCRSLPVTLPLAVEDPTARACPSITPIELVPTLPAPCRGSEYHAELIVYNGEAPYVWEAVALPDGLTFDEQTRRISGIPDAAGTATFQVEDGAGRTVQASYELEPRDACWLGYLSAESGVQRVELFDPVLRTRRTFPEDALADPVADFAFSPNGRFLAYRTLAQAGTERVRVLEMSTFHEQELGFTSVGPYAWSDDSTSLAFAFDTDQGRYLGGIDTAHAVSGGNSGVPIQFPLLGAIPAAVDGGPFWFAGTQLAFFSDTPPSQSVSSTRLTQGIFAAPRKLDAQFVPGATVRAGENGFFVIPTGDFVLVYYAADGSLGVPHDQVPRELRSISPSGRYLARIEDGSLQLFPSQKASYRDGEPADSASGCSAILAWSTERELIACATEEDGFGVVSLFDIDTTTHELLPWDDTVRGDYAYPPGAHVQRRRLFSPSGGRFLFTTDDTVYAAALDAGTPRVVFGVELPASLPNDNPFTALAFSPDEHFFLIHRGSRLGVVEFTPELDRVDETISREMPISERCEEDFRNVGSGYCGSEGPNSAYAWSPDSNWVVFQSETGALELYDLRFWLGRQFDIIPVTESCAGDCSEKGRFAFQP